jgi:hypothetical protein
MKYSLVFILHALSPFAKSLFTENIGIVNMEIHVITNLYIVLIILDTTENLI